MKKQTLFKSRFMICFILMCLFLNQSCRKDTLVPSKGANSLTIAEARNFFESNLKKNIGTKGKTMSLGDSKQKITYQTFISSKKAIWDKAYEKMISVGGAVKVPLDFGEARVIVDEKTKASMDFSTLNYLLMYKDSLQNIHAEWIYVQPTLDWLKGNRSIYRGSVTVKDWDGNIIKKFSYGLPVLNTTLNSNKISSLNNATMSGSEGTGYVVWNCIRVANGWCQVVRYCANVPQPCDFCLEYCAYEICEPLYTPDPPAGGNGGNNNNNGSGYGASNHGGSGGGPNPNDYPPTPCTNGQQVVNADGSMSPMPCIPEPSFPPTQNPTTVPLTATQFVIQTLGITDLDKVTFISDPSSGLNNAFAQYLVREKSSSYSIEFGQWLFEYLYANPTINYHDFLDQNEFSGLNNALLNDTSTPDLAIDMSGIVDIPDNTSFGPSRPLASSANRNNTEDLEFGTNGNISGILPLQLNKSDNLLFSDMTDLFELTSIGNLQTVAYQFIDRFKNGTGGTYENQTLNSEVKESGTYKNFIKKFRLDLQAKINNAGGILDNVKMELDYRPVFDGKKNRAIGFQILLNDTEETKINLLNFQINSATQEWIADVEVIIFDHFGLDKHDALVYQSSHRGFAGWWILQHKRNYKPFITKIVVKTRLYGGL